MKNTPFFIKKESKGNIVLGMADIPYIFGKH